MKILFISHSYPPIIGGIENQNFDLSKALSDLTEVEIIANTRGKAFLPIFVVITTVRAFLKMRKFDACLLGSGVLAPIGAFLKLFWPNKKFFSVVHGLDVTYANRNGILPTIYRTVNITSLKKLDQLFMVGNATIEEAIKIGISRLLCTFIPNGVFKEKIVVKKSRVDLEKFLGQKSENKKVILRVGRFVSHKGTSWFIKNIVPKLAENCIFVAAGNRVGTNTAGDKDDFTICEEIVAEQHLEKKVILFPACDWEDVKLLFNTADLVVSPNIKVLGSMEGFGINVIEAAVCKRVVIASNLEGLADAISDGENGFLVESENVSAWLEKINFLLEKDTTFMQTFGEKAAKYVEKHNTWTGIAKQYLAEMKKY
jgi:glycosyltransferase involved in cell wall biosynthesis